MVNIIVYQGFFNHDIGKLDSVVTTNTSDSEFGEKFNSFNEVDKLRSSLEFKEDPSKPTKIINYHQYVFLVVKTLHCRWTTEIYMQEF